jgi:hypothetical protein
MDSLRTLTRGREALRVSSLFIYGEVSPPRTAVVWRGIDS